jgi:hypothetical protein
MAITSVGTCQKQFPSSFLRDQLPELCLFLFLHCFAEHPKILDCRIPICGSSPVQIRAHDWKNQLRMRLRQIVKVILPSKQHSRLTHLEVI